MISVQNMTFTYSGGDQPAVNGVSFEVAPGEVFGFLGPSGAGKSTTQKILVGLLRGYEGDIRVLGKDLRSRPRARCCYSAALLPRNWPSGRQPTPSSTAFCG